MKRYKIINMQSKEYQRMFEAEEKDWWHRSRREFLRNFASQIPKKKSLNVLEVGCGSGINLEYFKDWGEMHGIDIASEALELCRRRGVKNVQKADVARLPFPDNHFDVVLSLDVLEHTEDDEDVLKEIHRVVKPGGWLLLTVPAFQFIWSDHDEALHHYRRYSQIDLSRKLKSADWKMQRLSYLFFSTFPIVMIVRLLTRLRNRKQDTEQAKTSYLDINSVANRLLLFILKFESRWLRLGSFPWGSSLIVLARKPGGEEIKIPRIHKMWPYLQEIYRFAVVGAIAGVIDIGLYFLFRKLGMHYLTANLISVAISIIANFFLNKYWTFRDTDRSAARRQFVQFFALNGVMYALQQILLVVGVAYLPLTNLSWRKDTIVKILVVILLSIVKYIFSKIWVFRTKNHKSDTK